jgi:hypothetical protein
MPREITFEEMLAAGRFAETVDNAFHRRVFEAATYDRELDKLIALARPEVLAAWKREQEPALFDEQPAPDPLGSLSRRAIARQAAEALIPESPPASSLSPRAAGRAAGRTPRPPLTGGALITEEGLLDALTALHADLTDGHFQPNLRDWPAEVHAYLMRHLERQSEAADTAEAAE